jgi:hypothetical protein
VRIRGNKSEIAGAKPSQNQIGDKDELEEIMDAKM